MNWFKRAQVNKKLLKNLEKKKQVSLQKGWTPEEVNWATNLSIKLGTPSYFLWLLNQTRNGSANIETREDDRKIFEVLHKFEELKNKKLVTEDINKYPSFSDLFNLVNRFQTEKSKEIGKELSEIKGARLLYSQYNVSVIKVTGSEAGEILFEDSGWCVKHPDTFERYGMPFLLFRIYNKNYALYHPATGNFKNRNDQRMDLNDTVKLLEAIKYLYRNRLIDPYGEAEIMLEVIEKTHEINDLCENNDLTRLKNKLSDNLAYAHLIDKFYLSPEVVQIVENIFRQKYNSIDSFKEIIDFYNNIPDYLNIRNFPLTEDMLIFILVEIEENPIYYDKLPGYLKNISEILQALKIGWMKKLKTDPLNYEYSYFPQDLKDDPEILWSRKIGWREKVKKHPQYYENSYFNQLLKGDPEILQSRRIGWMQILREKPDSYESSDFPQDLKDNPEMLQARKLGWIKRLGQYLADYGHFYFPKDLKQDPEILQTLKLGWMKELKKTPTHYDHPLFPQHLKNDPDILRIVGKIS